MGVCSGYFDGYIFLTENKKASFDLFLKTRLIIIRALMVKMHILHPYKFHLFALKLVV